MPPFETIVVVDHNGDLFRRVQQSDEQVILVSNRERPGLSGARNSGVRAASGDIVAFVDDDVIARPDWLEELVNAYQDSSVVGVGGWVEPCWTAGRPGWFPEEFNWVVGCSYEGLPKATSPIRNFIGANMSFRRHVFEAVGGFDPELGRVGTTPFGCEETEFCIRVHEKLPGSKLLHEPRARVLHRVPESRASWTYFRARCYAEGRSKATLTRLSGTGAGLASERVHAARVLPRAVARGIESAMVKRDGGALARAVVVVAGLVFTSIGYVAGVGLNLTQYQGRVNRVRLRSRHGPASPT